MKTIVAIYITFGDNSIFVSRETTLEKCLTFIDKLNRCGFHYSIRDNEFGILCENRRDAEICEMMTNQL